MNQTLLTAFARNLEEARNLLRAMRRTARQNAHMTEQSRKAMRHLRALAEPAPRDDGQDASA